MAFRLLLLLFCGAEIFAADRVAKARVQDRPAVVQRKRVVLAVPENRAAEVNAALVRVEREADNTFTPGDGTNLTVAEWDVPAQLLPAVSNAVVKAGGQVGKVGELALGRGSQVATNRVK